MFCNKEGEKEIKKIKIKKPKLYLIKTRNGLIEKNLIKINKKQGNNENNQFDLSTLYPHVDTRPAHILFLFVHVENYNTY